MSARTAEHSRFLARLGGAAFGFFLLKGLAWIGLAAWGTWMAAG